MKVIAHIKQDEVLLVQMTAREFANIAGIDYEREIAPPQVYGRRLTGMEVGTVLEVSPAWRRLREQDRLKDQLEGAAKSLESLAALVRYEAPRCIPTSAQPTEEGGGK